MRIELSALPGVSKLYRDYVTRRLQALDLFGISPFDTEGAKRLADSVSARDYDRRNLSRILLEQNKRWGADGAAIANCRRLAESGCLAVVTGQQVGLLGGPLLVLLKALHAAKLAAHCEEHTGRPVVPVFWMELEDHDLREVNRFTVINRHGELQDFSLPIDASSVRRPVNRIPLGDGVGAILEEIKSALRPTEFTGGLLSLAERCFRSDFDFGESFACLQAEMLSRFGALVKGFHPSAMALIENNTVATTNMPFKAFKYNRLMRKLPSYCEPLLF